MSDPRRALPSVDAALAEPALAELVALHSRPQVVDAVREILAARRATRRGPEGLADDVAAALAPSMRRVINATGVLLNTNLGRAPLAPEAVRAAAEAGGYGTVEWDPTTGERRPRHEHVTDHLRLLCGAEDAVVLNTNAGAVLASLCALAGADGEGPREAIISRGQLVEIGGGFRVPDIMVAAGCRMVEVGTTNRTHRDDYAMALGPRAGAILRVHRSNFHMVGFVEDVPLVELAELARAARVPLIDDLGSGLLTPDPALPDEPDARSSLEAGATAVCFSADKLLGGPQAGIVAGSMDAVSRVARHPISRALRVDKVRLAALSATLALHRDPSVARRKIPVLRVIHEDPEVRRRRASALAESVGGEVVPTEGAIGGGAAPGTVLVSYGVVLPGADAPRRAARLRMGRVPVAARVQEGRVVLDVLALEDRDLGDLSKIVVASG